MNYPVLVVRQGKMGNDILKLHQRTHVPKLQ